MQRADRELPLGERTSLDLTPFVVGTVRVKGVNVTVRLAQDQALAPGQRITKVHAARRPFFEGGTARDENCGSGEESEELLKHGDMVTT